MIKDRNKIVDRLLLRIATLGFIGYLPTAPGTFGSLVAFVVFIFLMPSVSALSALLLLLIPVAIVSSYAAERLLNEKDSGHIVIDEVCGFFTSVIFLPLSFGHAVAAFFLFRFFDILKPFPIRRVEQGLPGGIGIVADDLIAGLYANILLQIWIYARA